MTLEKASELVSALRERNLLDNKAEDLFEHFVDTFGLSMESALSIETFAEMCGYGIAIEVRKVGD
jgi:hypothetical protein